MDLILRWVEAPGNAGAVLRRKEFMGLLAKVKWGEVENATLVEVMRNQTLAPLINKQIDILQKVKEELSKRAEASCLANLQRTHRKSPTPTQRKIAGGALLHSTREGMSEEEEEQAHRQAVGALGEYEASKDMRASSYEEAPSSGMPSFHVVGGDESTISGQPAGMSLESFTRDMKLA